MKAETFKDEVPSIAIARRSLVLMKQHKDPRAHRKKPFGEYLDYSRKYYLFQPLVHSATLCLRRRTDRSTICFRCSHDWELELHQLRCSEHRRRPYALLRGFQLHMQRRRMPSRRRSLTSPCQHPRPARPLERKRRRVNAARQQKSTPKSPRRQPLQRLLQVKFSQRLPLRLRPKRI